MAKIENRDVLKRIEQDAGIQAGIDKLPDQLNSTVVPVLKVNPERICNIAVSGNRTVASPTGIYTTPSNKDFYLTSLCCDYIKDANNDDGTGSFPLVQVTINGATINLVEPAIITLTAQTGTYNLNFTVPIKLDRGTSVVLGAVTIGAGVFVRSAAITGYTVEPV